MGSDDNDDPGTFPAVLSSTGSRRRRILRHDLARFVRPAIPDNRGFLVRAGWYVVNATVFQGALLGLVPSSIKAHILRRFGARVWRGLVCKPRVSIKYPWFLSLGDDVWLGEGVWIDNHCGVTIGSSTCVSQGCYLFTGNHDYNDVAFAFFAKPIRIGEGAWIGARVVVPPGSVVPDGTVVGCGYDLVADRQGSGHVD